MTNETKVKVFTILEKIFKILEKCAGTNKPGPCPKPARTPQQQARAEHDRHIRDTAERVNRHAREQHQTQQASGKKPPKETVRERVDRENRERKPPKESVMQRVQREARERHERGEHSETNN